VIRSVEQMPPQAQINSFTSLAEPERNNQLPPSGRSGIVPEQSGYPPAISRDRSCLGCTLVGGGRGAIGWWQHAEVTGSIQIPYLTPLQTCGRCVD
jgi:hypothetical protein